MKDMKEGIHHDAEAGKFYISLADGLATLKYRRLDDKTVDFYSTFVPGTRRGEGIGSRLVKHALDWAQQESLLVRPSCPFVDKYIKNHPASPDIKI